MEKEIGPGTYDLRDLWKVFVRYRGWWLYPTLLLGLLALIMSFLTPNSYKATLTALPPEVAGAGLFGSGGPSLLTKGVPSNALQAIAILKSREIKERAIDHFRLDTLYEADSREKVIRKFSRDLRVFFDQNAGVIRVEAISKDPELAAQIANFVVNQAEEINERLQVFLRKPMLRVVDKAVPPERKYRPRRGVNTAAGLIVGFFLGLLLVFARHSLDDRLNDALSAKKSLPEIEVFSTVPRLKGVDPLRTSDAAFPPVGLFPFLEKFTEMGRGLFAFTGPRGKEGKTFLTLCAGRYLSANYEVLLIDANPTSKGITALTGLSGNRGISDMGDAESLKELIAAPEGFSFSVLPAGQGRAIDFTALSSALEHFISQFEFVLLELPGMLTPGFPVEMLRIPGSILLVLRYSVSRLSDIREIGLLFGGFRDRLRLVLNDYDEKIHSL